MPELAVAAGGSKKHRRMIARLDEAILTQEHQAAEMDRLMIRAADDFYAARDEFYRVLKRPGCKEQETALCQAMVPLELSLATLKGVAAQGRLGLSIKSRIALEVANDCQIANNITEGCEIGESIARDVLALYGHPPGRVTEAAPLR